MKKRSKEMMYSHHGWALALVIFGIGLLFLLRDMGMGYIPAGISIWHVLVTVIGLKMLIHQAVC